MSKPYGLIVPNKSQVSSGSKTVKRPSIFDEDSDSEAKPERPTGLKTTLKRHDRVAREKAVEEDPTVYQYDEIYDDMDQKRKESKLSRKDLDKKPKYINKLLEAANRRKQENERRIERQVQKEREAEGDEFKDKEAFVTTAYRKKLEEMKKLEEEEEREAYLESIGDVKRQGNLDGFYRHLYDQKVNYEEKSDEKLQIDLVKQETVTDSDGSSKSGNDPTPDKSEQVRKKRKYRTRDDSCSDDDKVRNADVVKMEHLPSNLDADSDFSIDSDSDGSEEGDAKKSKREEVSGGVQASGESKTDVKVEEKEDEVKIGDKGVEKVKEEDEKLEEEVKEIKQPKIDIWKKRTVGVVFDEALQRYYERKALREAGN